MVYKIQLKCGLTVMSGTEEQIVAQLDKLSNKIGKKLVNRLFKTGTFTINNQ